MAITYVEGQVRLRLAFVFLLWSGLAVAQNVSYNGIPVPASWPPRAELTREPSEPPYLVSPPKVILIDVGRQLFVDDFLIQSTTLRRAFHLPEDHPKNPVLWPEAVWETKRKGKSPRQGPLAMPFSGGAWFDPRDKLYKLWYHANYRGRHLCLVTSRNGVDWERPTFDVVPGTNIVFPRPGGARVVWLDLAETDPARRFKLIVTRGGKDLLKPGQEWFGSLCSMYVHFSPDGIHWSKAAVRTGPTGDRNSAFYNPFRKKWVYSIRTYLPFGDLKKPQRIRRYWESADLIEGLPWKYREPPLWLGADRLDKSHGTSRMAPQLYNFDAVGYESVMLGLFNILRAPSDRIANRPKINEVCLGYSRDGYHFSRPDRRSFLRVDDKPRSWRWGNVQSVGGGCLIVGDRLHFYFSCRQGTDTFSDAAGGAGLAVLRRDGFASMDAGDKGGTLTTRPVRFSGKRLFVNLDAPKGELRAEILDEAGKPITPFTPANCAPVSGDRTLAEASWRGADLASVAGKPVRFRFHLKRGRLYAFWVSPDASGASHGYVAAGGPGFTGPTDTVGKAGYPR